MNASLAGLFGAIGAGIAVVSTVVYYIFKWKELRVLREIRDRMPKPRSK